MASSSHVPDPTIRSMRAAEGFHVEWVKDEAVVLDPESGELHYLNAPAAVVYALILEYGYSQALEEVARMGDSTELQESLPDLIDQMLEKGLLEVP